MICLLLTNLLDRKFNIDLGRALESTLSFERQNGSGDLSSEISLDHNS